MGRLQDPPLQAKREGQRSRLFPALCHQFGAAERITVRPRPRYALIMRILPLAFLLVGCQPEADAPIGSREIALPRQTPEAAQAQMLALLSGTLSLDGRCLYVSEDGGDTRYFVVWPPSASIVKVPTDSLLHVLDSDTGVSIPIRMSGGSRIVLGGGEVGNRPPSRSTVDYPIPEECLGPFWIANSVLDRMPTPQPSPPDPPPPSP